MIDIAQAVLGTERTKLMNESVGRRHETRGCALLRDQRAFPALYTQKSGPEGMPVPSTLPFSKVSR